MANIRYNVTCPSCEASVPIRSSAAVGKKTECPKCKYRFVVPEPGDEEDDKEKEGGAAGKKGKKAAKAKSGNSKMLLGLILGGVAVVALVVGGIVVLGGGDDSGPKPAGNTTGAGSSSGVANSGGPAGTEMPGSEMPGTETPQTEPPKTPSRKSAAPAGPGKDITNLLPNDTRAVYRINVDRLAQVGNPLYTAFLDSYVRDLFRNSLTFGPDQVAYYVHCVVDPDREPFAIIRTKTEFDERDILQRLQLEKPKQQGALVKKDYFLIKSNAFIDAVSQAFSSRSLASLAGLPLPTDSPPAKPAPDKKYALCVYDSSTLLISTEGVLERYLSDLGDNGFPPFKTELIPEQAPAPPPMNPDGGGEGPGGPPGVPPGIGPMGPMAPGAPAAPSARGSTNDRRQPPSGGSGRPPGPPAGVPGPPGGVPMGPPGAGAMGPPGGAPMGPPGAPGGPGGAPAAPMRRPYTSIPTYRTVDPQLKKMLNQLEEDEQNPPAAVYAEILDQRYLNAKALAQAARQTGDMVLGVLSQIRVVGVALKQFNREKGALVVALEYVSDDDARKSATEQITPILNLAKGFLDPALGTQISIRNAGSQGGFGPGDSGPLGPPGGFPMGPGGEGPPLSPRPPGGFGPPPGVPGPPGGAGVPPPGGFGPGGPPGAPGDPSFPGGTTQPGAGSEPSTIDIDVTDRVVTVSADIKWAEERYNSLLQAGLSRLAGQLKGRMAVLAGETDVHTLARAAVKLGEQKRPFPRGTLPRDAGSDRFGIPPAPEHRVSFFAELLPFVGKGGLRTQIFDKKFAWHAKEHLPAAEAWVPEFLVPYYPQTSWRATHPLAGDRSLGGTNYVGLAGLGLDAARYNPANPEHAKKLGLLGYDWSSRPEDIKDGLSNTIFLIQVPPGTGRPWIAGGGATLMGVDDTATDPMRDFVHRRPDGQRGTFVLMADGSVRWVKEGTDPKVFKGLVTRAGGETIEDLNKLAPAEKPTRAPETELRAGGPVGKEPAAPKTSIDDEELKKFQGRWRVKFAVLQGKPASADDLAKLNITVTFEGTTSTITFGEKTEKTEIIRLDPKASPKRLDMKETDTGKIEVGVYEFVGANVVKLRAAGTEKDLPKTVSVPQAGAKGTTYLELERVN